MSVPSTAYFTLHSTAFSLNSNNAQTVFFRFCLSSSHVVIKNKTLIYSMCLIRGCCQITMAWFLQWRHGMQGKQWHPCVLTRVGTGVNGGVIAGWTIKGQWGHTLGQQPAAGGGWSMCLFAYTSKPSLSSHWGVCLAWSLPTPSTYSIYPCHFFFFLSFFSPFSKISISWSHFLYLCLFLYCYNEC